ncbi:adenylyltransferase/sulfurtransferase MoeZ [Mycolicibacterium sp.]|uniref:adenylyltransferase/sulfurtransferase MoeZ n=1 Tax=Mycolicibacterium sp. TaxID=2320850 RepID=UPI0028AF2351|nr:adenylyltransferase/sulfurtransferase MoeZ [Mycolicibacterium sp.]
MPLPPLVEPAAELSRAEIARYSRHLLLPDVGPQGQKRLKNARVLVIGAGGLGSPALLYLAAAGVGTLGVVDFDVVEESNLQRQIIHGQSDIGRLKVDSARDAIAEVNPLVTVRAYPYRLEPANAVEVFAEYDLVIDGADNFATRYLVNDAAVLAGKPYVWGSIYRFTGQVSVFWENAPHGRGVNYRDLYPDPPPPGLVPSCAEGGVLGLLCASIAAVMGTEAVKLITGIGESLLGRLLIYDALAMSHRTIAIRKDPQAPPITALADYVLCGAATADDADHGLTPAELKDLLDSGAAVTLIDVREPGEWEINRIDGARLIPKSVLESADGPALLPAGRIPVLYCKSGTRSAQALAALKAAGITDALHLRGGITAWARQFDPDMATY